MYDIEVKNIDGESISLSHYRGKVLLIVNVASECGFTPQYKGLEELYEAYKERGFHILAFPCNQFRGQEPKHNDAIKIFCQEVYKITFDLFAKIDVNGEHASPLYSFLKQEQSGLFNSDIKWNFTKFLVDRDGKVVERFAPLTKPKRLKKSIEKLLEG